LLPFIAHPVSPIPDSPQILELPRLSDHTLYGEVAGEYSAPLFLTEGSKRADDDDDD
jgi:hypothetical protein